jgi:hypothetical protein
MVKNILVKFHRGSEEFNKPMKGIKDNGINRDVIGRLIILQTINIRQLSLQPVITILNKKNVHGYRLEVKISK